MISAKFSELDFCKIKKVGKINKNNKNLKIMAKEVIKRDGAREPFDAGKIRNAVLMAAGEAGLEETKKNEVVEQVTAKIVQMVDAKDEITTSEIKASILAELDSVEPSVSAAWRKYDSEHKQA
ncbi:MAG: hypothetical protein A3H01_00880 [Candidatus Wildermuthbacteria bacterium RIFCSPLOWO2_12_FULL_40_9]|uniref:ATP-cone domain-containing protein n=2 Tax=Candidatus Wildermuthiibacteriota TaxID=1817923 RepID=A0A1G2RDJ1_9BACT|nr:MAG: hypothetical protein A3F15_02100 [Candidatus Wildermuthbacteria bacterium RIFCSPHIGHO2_12_FULL_40_12]OHA76815.1 MAG: hypothetical protein A3H01_00880 [Candidatus Wildermuthbacteria bacterium RIFCSPLOWO2_12_FULL_40_9]